MKATRFILLPSLVLGICLGLWGYTALGAGRDFDGSRAKHIVNRKTTADQIRAMFGSPLRRYEVKDIGEGWTYTFESAPKNAPAFRKNLTVLFDKNKVVLHFWLRQGPIPGQPAQLRPGKTPPPRNDGSAIYLQKPAPKTPPPIKRVPITPPPVKRVPITPPPVKRIPATPPPIKRVPATPPPIKRVPMTPPPAKRVPMTPPPAKHVPATPAPVKPPANTPPPTSNAATPKPAVEGQVKTTIANQSPSFLMLKIERHGNTVAQSNLAAGGSKNMLIPPGEYGLKLKLNGQYYRAPGFNVGSHAASLNLIWNPSNMANLHPITEQEFAR